MIRLRDRTLSDRAEVIDALEVALEQVDGDRDALAGIWGISPGYIRLVMDGHKDPGPAILSRLGFVKVTAYKRVQT